jgi:8-oxo-dGTP diphosphatase
VPVLLVRHGEAGDRRKWPGPDHLRPLSPLGRRQAEALAGELEGLGVARILSSPFVRCVQSVEPLAARLGLAVESDPALAEGAETADAVALVRRLAGSTAVVCNHGDVLRAVLDALAAEDGLAMGADYPAEKGSTWVLRDEGGRFVAAEYLPPPDRRAGDPQPEATGE